VDLPAVTRPDVEARRAAVARHAELAVPDGALGRLAELGVWLAAAQGRCPPRPPTRARVVVVAGDHGVARLGVSADPPRATLRQVLTVHQQSAPVSVLARMAGTSVRVVDVALDHDVPEDALAAGYRVRRSTGRIDREDAMTAEEVERAVEIGRRLADEEVDAGADLLIPASLGVGATTPAATLVAAVTGTEPVAVIGRGSGIDDNGWMRKAAVVRDALRRARPHIREPLEILRVAGGADIAVLAGFCLQGALRRTPVLLDGLVVGAAALVADELRLGARDWWLIAQRSPEPAMAFVGDHLDLEPILDLGVRLGDGTGAAAVVPLLQMSARLLAESVTAEDLGIG
jgi:nicotinate-nucleotide--dimethylbenzimidazole phosphoribosyltransferase